MAKKTLLGGAFDDDHTPDPVVPPVYAEIMKGYEIDPDAPLFQRWRELAEKLAEEFHPAFPKKPGRHAHRNRAYYGMLISNVRWMRKREGFKHDSTALKFLYENHPNLLVGLDRVAVIPSLKSLEADLKTARKVIKEKDFI